MASNDDEPNGEPTGRQHQRPRMRPEAEVSERGNAILQYVINSGLIASSGACGEAATHRLVSKQVCGALYEANGGKIPCVPMSSVVGSVEMLDRALRVSMWSGAGAHPLLLVEAFRTGNVDVIESLVHTFHCKLDDIPTYWEVAIKAGSTAAVAWVYVLADDEDIVWDSRACYWAAEGAHIDTLEWLRGSAGGPGGHFESNPCAWDGRDIREDPRARDRSPYIRGLNYLYRWNACKAAILGGHFATLQWLRAQQPPCALTRDAFLAATRTGNLATLKWLKEEWERCEGLSDEGTEFSRFLEKCSFTIAAETGNIEMLKWLCAQECSWGTRAYGGAAKGGHMETLKWLRSQDACPPWPDADSVDGPCGYAAEQGNLALLKWLRSQDPPCPWVKKSICERAVKAGHLNILQYVCSVDPPCVWPVYSGRAATSSWNLPHASAAGGGHLDVLQFLQGQDAACPRSPATGVNIACERAANGGHLATLKWLRAQDPPYPWGISVCEAAAKGGHTEMLAWLRAQDPPCPWGVSVCRAAAEHGHLDTLKFLRSQEPPCPWGTKVCQYAALNGHFSTLRWLRAQDPPCPWDATVLKAAAENGRHSMIRWMRSCNPPCPWDVNTCLIVATDGDIRTLKFLRSFDPPCPWDWTACQGACTGDWYNDGYSKGDKLETLIWLRTQDPPCPWDPQRIIDDDEYGRSPEVQFDVLEWIYDHSECEKREGWNERSMNRIAGW